MPRNHIEPPEMHDTVTRKVEDYEVFLGFSDDWEAVAFEDWWNGPGFKAFAAWVHKRQKADPYYPR